MIELNTGVVKFTLEEFYIGSQGMNYTFIGDGFRANAFVPYAYALVYVDKGELELVKNFLTTIRS